MYLSPSALLLLGFKKNGHQESLLQQLKTDKGDKWGERVSGHWYSRYFPNHFDPCATSAMTCMYMYMIGTYFLAALDHHFFLLKLYQKWNEPLASRASITNKSYMYLLIQN